MGFFFSASDCENPHNAHSHSHTFSFFLMPTTYYLKATAYEAVHDASALLRLFDGTRCVGRWYANGVAFCLCEVESHQALQARFSAASLSQVLRKAAAPASLDMAAGAWEWGGGRRGRATRSARGAQRVHYMRRARARGRARPDAADNLRNSRLAPSRENASKYTCFLDDWKRSEITVPENSTF